MVSVKTLQDSKNPLKTQCFQGIKLVREAGLELWAVVLYGVICYQLVLFCI